ncbi:SOS response-associated peptidase [Bifidobacterium jacchi]|uniref:SOS response-associated peptidase n=1 Tax=Bifidobacterium jacchi TaxID=2490545 RepID=UPI001F4F8270|nr:SOS response-associated peptidase [Bifidobacterium jacchi]
MLLAVCRCFAADVDWSAVAKQFGVESNENVDSSGNSGTDAASLPRPSYNVRPGQTITVVAQSRDGRRHLSGARWSLVPSWSAGPALTYPTYNARIESAAVKPTFAESTRSMRAIIPASGYYEYHGRRPFYFHAPDDGPLAMAGLFSWWRSPQSTKQQPMSWMLTATILTCPAVDGPATVHDRMPVLVPSDMTGVWLDRSTDGSSLLAGLTSNGTELSRRLAFHEVAPFAPMDDGRRIIRPLAQAEAPTLF